MFVVVLLVASVVQYSSSGHQFARFSETKTIQSKCTDVAELIIRSINSLDCARLCTADRECRRYMYCSSTSSCQLYQDGTDCFVSGDSTSCSCFRKDIGFYGSNSTCPLGYYGDACQFIIKGCSEGTQKNIGENLRSKRALTYIKPSTTSEPFEIPCFLDYGGSWYVFSRKAECNDGTFNRSLAEYEEGFGTTRYNFWLGFNKLRDIISSGIFQIQIKLVAASGRECFSNYVQFSVSDKASGYIMTTTSAAHRGNLPFCGDSILGTMSLSGNPFSTYDVDHTGTYHCASRLGGGWWFDDKSDCARGFFDWPYDRES